MSRVAPSTGTVLTYPYLWRWQAENGETEGRKDRPVCVLVALPKGSTTHLVLLAVSATPPRDDQMALPIPPLECRRAGLREWKGGWVTVSEYNYDVAERSWFFDPNAKVFGQFSPAFLGKIAAAARPFMAQPGSRVDRADLDNDGGR